MWVVMYWWLDKRVKLWMKGPTWTHDHHNVKSAQQTCHNADAVSQSLGSAFAHQSFQQWIPAMNVCEPKLSAMNVWEQHNDRPLSLWCYQSLPLGPHWHRTDPQHAQPGPHHCLSHLWLRNQQWREPCNNVSLRLVALLLEFSHACLTFVAVCKVFTVVLGSSYLAV